MLSTKNLVKLYSYILAFSSLYLAYIVNPIPWTLATIPSAIYNVLVRCLLVGVYFLTRSWPGGYPRTYQNRSYGLCSLLDSLMICMFFVAGFVRFQPVIYLSIVIILQTSLWISLPKIYRFLKESWEDTKRTRNQFGISHLIQVESGRLKISTVFRLFWISRAIYDAFYRVGAEPVSQVLKYVMTHGSETLPGVIGLTVTVSAVCHQVIISPFLQSKSKCGDIVIVYHISYINTTTMRYNRNRSTFFIYFPIADWSISPLDSVLWNQFRV